MDAFQRTYERATAKIGRTKKKVQDKLGLPGSRSTSAPIESAIGNRSHSENPSSHPRASTDETTVRRDAIGRNTANSSNAAQGRRSELRVGRGGLDTETLRSQDLPDMRTSKQGHFA
jgi:hypothetical protein